MYFRIDLQLHTECNRKCDWCLFGHYNVPKHKMSDKIFEKTLDYIQKHIDEFEKPLWFVLHKFFEPMMYPDILYKRTKQIKERFPDSKIKINSNCDNINSETIYALKYVDKLSVPNYANMMNLQKVCKINEVSKDDSKLMFGNIGNTLVIVHTKEIPILSRGSALYETGKDKYGFSDEITTDCCIYGQYFSIAYDGSIMPCYDTVPYINSHKDVILGNVLDNYIFDKNYSFENKECCKHCNVNFDNCCCAQNR